MNKDLLESQWVQIREILKDKFSNLTEEDIRQINGHYDQLVAKLQQKYGYSKEEAEERIKNWNFDRFTSASKGQNLREDRAYLDDKARLKKDNSNPTLLKWLTGLLTLLFLLGLYYLPQATTHETVTTPTTVNRAVVVENVADRAISDGIKNVLISSPLIASDIQNLQITTHNGVVTISGSVPSVEVRDSILNTAQNYSGVTQVINDLIVK